MMDRWGWIKINYNRFKNIKIIKKRKRKKPQKRKYEMRLKCMILLCLPLHKKIIFFQCLSIFFIWNSTITKQTPKTGAHSINIYDYRSLTLSLTPLPPPILCLIFQPFTASSALQFNIQPKKENYYGKMFICWEIIKWIEKFLCVDVDV